MIIGLGALQLALGDGGRGGKKRSSKMAIFSGYMLRAGPALSRLSGGSVIYFALLFRFFAHLVSYQSPFILLIQARVSLYYYLFIVIIARFRSISVAWYIRRSAGFPIYQYWRQALLYLLTASAIIEVYQGDQALAARSGWTYFGVVASLIIRIWLQIISRYWSISLLLLRGGIRSIENLASDSTETISGERSFQ